jgi:excisionase family DNA binding protein
MSIAVQLPADLQVRVLDLGATGHGPAAIARQLGVPVSAIANTFRKGQAAGTIPRRPSVKGRDWTRKAEQELITYVEQGWGYDWIARRLKRSRTAIEVKCKRLGVRITTTKATLSARDVAELLGKRCSKSVRRWIDNGWLNARNAGRPERPLWRVQWEDLTAFMENPAYWSTWDPKRIADLALREWAQEIRAEAPKLLTQHEVARRYHVEHKTVAQWIDKGWLTAVRAGRQNRLIPETALEGFVPPCLRDRTTWSELWWPRDGWRIIRRVGGVTVRRRPNPERWAA